MTRISTTNKKITAILYFFSLVLLLPFISYLILNNSYFQNSISRIISHKLSSKLGIRISAEKVRFDLFHGIIIKNLYISDLQYDSLLSCQQATIDLQHILLKNNQIRFRIVELNSAKLFLKVDSNNQLNIIALLKKIAHRTDTVTQSNWKFNFKNITLENSELFFQNDNQQNKFKSLHLKELKVRLKNLQFDKEKISFKINRLTFKESTGFQLSNLSAQIDITQKYLNLKKLYVYTPTSNIEVKQMAISSDSILKFTDQFNQLHVKLEISLLKISTHDLSFFFPTFKDYNSQITCKADILGTLNNLKCKNVWLSFENRNFYKGNIHITRLPNIQLPYLYIDVKQLTFWPADIQKILSAEQHDKIELPNIFRKFDYITYKGNYTGFFDDFVMYGQIFTPLGKLNIDLLLKPIAKDDIIFNGSVETFQLNIGKIINNEQLIGPTNLQIKTSGFFTNKKYLNATIDAIIAQTSINGYELKNIITKGKFEHSIFKGYTSIDDPNLNFTAEGTFDFSNHFPLFNFTAAIKHINLFALNIFKTDTITHAAAQIEANFKGNAIDKVDGIASIKNFELAKPQQACLINKIEIESLNNHDIKKISVTSDIADIQIENPYNFQLFLNDLHQWVISIFPSNSNNLHQVSNAKNFQIEAHFKHLDPFIHLFEPHISIADNSKLLFKFSPYDSTLAGSLFTNRLLYKSTVLNHLNINITSNWRDGILEANSELIQVSTNVILQNISANVDATNGNAKVIVNWNDSLRHNNNINFFINNISFNNRIFTQALLNIDSSQVYILNQPWNIRKAEIFFDTSSIYIPNLYAYNQSSVAKIQGKYSENPLDTLSIYLKNFDMSIINYLFQADRFKFDGKISTQISFYNHLKQKQVKSFVNIDSFKINKQLIGQSQLLAEWNNNLQHIDIELTSNQHKLKPLIIKGYYVPLGKTISLSVEVNEIPLNILHPIFGKVFTIENGDITGQLVVLGRLKQPVLNGNLAINDAQLLINVLNTHYKFNKQVLITNNKFVFEPFKLFDENNRSLTCQGEVNNTYLKNFRINFILNATNNLVFNQSDTKKLPFYGKGYASGIIKIFGPTEKIKIDIIQSKTEKNTEIIIPLDQKEISVENDFIKFTHNLSDGKQIHSINPNAYLVNNSGLLLNVDLEVTPDANVQLIFNPKIGDALQAQGRGNLKFEIDNTGNFYLRGIYNIEEGEYTFTMQNLMNKKFILQNNSNILFNGNLTDATLDIRAVYHTRAALYNLLGDPSIEYKKRIPVDCQLFISGKLVNPDIRLSIDFPNSAEETKTRIRSILNSDQEISQQFIALLVLNNFIPTSNASLPTRFESTNFGRDAATTTSFELLTSQLSNWVSKLSKDFDIGVSYRPGDRVYSNEDLEIALSTQLLNNRMIINSNIDIVGSQNQNRQIPNTGTNLIGDINIEYRITDRLSFKAFNRANDIIYFQDDIYTRGIGITYREEFSSFQQLIRNYFTKKQTIK